MTRSVRRLLFWAPRVLGILYALFLSVFALDVFDAGYGFWKTVAALLIHLIPTAILLIVLAVSWRWEWVGAVLFIALAVFYVAVSWGRFPGSVYVVMAGPLVVLGLLFLANWQYRAELRAGP